MNHADLPLLLSPEQFEDVRGRAGILLVDLSEPATYVQYHVPDAVFMEYAWIVRVEQPRMGLLPTPERLAHVFSAYGLTPETHVVAYDDEGGGRACRLLYTLEAAGHTRYSLLDGGLRAWANAGHPIDTEIHWPTPGTFTPHMNFEPVATRQYILDHLSDPEVVLLDARSRGEYTGEKRYARRGGHIPGAVHMEWTEAMDRERDLRLKPAAELRAMLAERGVTSDKTVVVYCQTHHRSAHTWFLLKYLGFDKVKGYPGSWSDWGNEPNTPIEREG